ncbi:efflux RND transporter periplasmic adaptor subunit [Shigella flexneri]
MNVHDNQLVKKGQILSPSTSRAIKRRLRKRKPMLLIIRYWHRRNARRPDVVTVSVCRRCLAKEIDQANNVLQTVLHQLAKAQATRDLAKLDLERTVIRAPADGWVTNLNVYTGEFITRGSTAVALVKQNSFYVLAYMEETKLEGVRPGYRAEITPLGSNKVLKRDC